MYEKMPKLLHFTATEFWSNVHNFIQDFAIDVYQ